MKLELYIDGKRKDMMNIDFLTTNLYRVQELINNAVERLKISNTHHIREAKTWEIFMIRKSKMK